MTVRRLWRAVEARTAAEWNRFAHLMAAAFWSRGHRISPDDLNPLKASQSTSSESDEIAMESDAHDTVAATKIRVAAE